MENPRKTPWFQVHLSTAIVLLLMTGAFLWMNFCYDLDKTYLKDYEYINDTFVAQYEPAGRFYGWPISAYSPTRVMVNPRRPKFAKKNLSAISESLDNLYPTSTKLPIEKPNNTPIDLTPAKTPIDDIQRHPVVFALNALILLVMLIIFGAAIEEQVREEGE